MLLKAPCTPLQPTRRPEVSPEGSGPPRDPGSGLRVTSGWSNLLIPNPLSFPLSSPCLLGGMLLNGDTCPYSAWSFLVWPGRGRTIEGTRVVAVPPGAVAVCCHCHTLPREPPFAAGGPLAGPVAVMGWSSDIFPQRRPGAQGNAVSAQGVTRVPCPLRVSTAPRTHPCGLDGSGVGHTAVTSPLGRTRPGGTWPSPGEPRGHTEVPGRGGGRYLAPWGAKLSTHRPRKQRFLGWVAALCNGRASQQRVQPPRRAGHCYPLESPWDSGDTPTGTTRCSGHLADGRTHRVKGGPCSDRCKT